MSGGVGHALDQAVALWRAPALVAAARQRPLPDDVLHLVRIAAGDATAAQEGAHTTGTEPGEINEAATFYLQQLLFSPQSDSYRTLGVNPDAPDARIKEHYRWLVRWLHPDRNPDEWEAHYADRVNRAWQDLRTPEKREAYDATLAAIGPVFVGGASAPKLLIGAEAPPTSISAPLLSATTTRRLPYYVLGSFGALAGALLTLMWYAQTRPLNTRAVGASAGAPTTAIAPEPPPAGAPSGATPEPVNSLPPPPTQRFVAVPDPVPKPAVAAPIGAEAPPTKAEPTRVATTPPVGGASAPITQARPAPASVVADEAVEEKSFAAEAAPAVASEPATHAAPAPITEPAAQALLARYTTAYANGDLPALMQLFSQDAVTNSGGREMIAYDYRNLFDRSRKREITLRRQGWLQRGERTTVLAHFETEVVPRGALFARRSEGDIRFDLGWEDGELRILGIHHVEG